MPAESVFFLVFGILFLIAFFVILTNYETFWALVFVPFAIASFVVGAVIDQRDENKTQDFQAQESCDALGGKLFPIKDTTLTVGNTSSDSVRLLFYENDTFCVIRDK